MMVSMTRRTFITLCPAAGVLGMAKTASAAPRILTVASLFGADKPETRIWFRIRDIVEQKLPGQFSFRIVQNAALGGEKEVAEGIRLGSVQGSLSTVSALSGWVPETQVLDLPFLFQDAAHLERVLAGDTGQDLRQKLAAQNFIAPAYINYGARHLLTKTAITRREQLEGLRIRVIQSPLHTELWHSLGANPTAIPIPETYNALKTGVVDAMDLTKSAYAGFKLYEVVPYLIETSHIWAAGVVYFSRPFWNSLTNEQREVFEEAAREGSRYFDQLIVEDEIASMAVAAKAGGQVVKPENRAEWEAGARKVWQSYAAMAGGMDRIERIRAS